MLNILKDTDLFYWRRLLLILHRYQIVLYIILGLFALQIVLSLPLVGSIITSIMWKIKLLLVKLISVFISFITSTLPRFGLGVLPLLEKVCVAIQQLIIPSNEWIWALTVCIQERVHHTCRKRKKYSLSLSVSCSILLVHYCWSAGTRCIYIYSPTVLLLL